MAMTDHNENKDTITLRVLDADEREAALELAWRVFSEYESPDYSPEGSEEFRSCLHDEAFLAGMRCYGAFDGLKLVGLAGVRPERGHITLFFVDGSYHRRGIGTRLFGMVREDLAGRDITLNSSPYGLPFYQRQGFRAQGCERTENGIRFTPMVYRRKAALYVHGRGGSACESAHYEPLFPGRDVIGLDYSGQTPWEAGAEIRAGIEALRKRYDSVVLIASSIGAFFSMCAGLDGLIERAYLISPSADMEGLILGMMRQAGVSEEELREREKISLESGDELSWGYLRYVREHPLSWSVPTEILYGSEDSLFPREAVSSLAGRIGAGLSVMDGAGHWFHTEEERRFLDEWIESCEKRCGARW